MMRRHPMVIGTLGGIIGTILVAVAFWLTVAYTGAYNVAASDQHADVVRWTLDTTMRRSVNRRAGDVAIPADASEELIAAGAGHYAKSCAHCHGSPGAQPAEWSRGMRPEPPQLTEVAAEWSSEEIHWIITNGIKMSGMPSFRRHHSAEEIVALAAFVSLLPGLSASDYQALTRSGGSGASGPG